MKNLFNDKESEKDLMKSAMAESLEVKIEKAVKLLQVFEPTAISLNPQGYFLCNSFGKDSGAIYHLAKLAGIRFTNNHSVTTLDPPELMRFGRGNYPDIVMHRKPKTLINRMVDKANPPTRRGRWCCAEYKEGGGTGWVKIIGVRAAESARRAGIWKQVVYNLNGGIIVCPALYWTEKDVWTFHEKYNLPYCELYRQGFKRLGCIGCPLSGSTGQKRDFKRWPKYEAMWKQGFKRLWDKWHGVPNRKGEPRFFEKFGNVENFWKWWISGKKHDSQAECQGEFMFGLIDENDGEIE